MDDVDKMEDLDLYVQELKAKFDDIVKTVFNDEEELSAKEFSLFAEDMVELNHMMIKHIRMLYYRLETLEKVAKLDKIAGKLDSADENFSASVDQVPDDKDQPSKNDEVYFS